MKVPKRQKKDTKLYLSKLEARANLIETRFREAAPDAYESFKKDERTSPRLGIGGNRRPGLVSDPSSLAVPPNSVLLADEKGIGVYLGINSIWLH